MATTNILHRTARATRRVGGRIMRRLGLHNGRGETAPLKGYATNATEIKLVDRLSDADLQELNAMLDWKSFVADRHGRRFGNIAWAGKRTDPQAIPDARIVLL